jgi:UDP-N-acetylglucosamine diphosphorylase/glucosamine-1-phosphate N-acetyltransferase
MNVILIMAGGLGKRMNSDLPKVLHTLNGKPMIIHVVNSALEIDDVSIIYIIVGKHRELIENSIPRHPRIKYVNQLEPLGTGHAIQCCREELLKYRDNTRVLILSGDVPLFTTRHMRDVIDYSLYPVTIVTTCLDNPYGYGRIVESDANVFLKIVEEKDCDDKEKRICKVNCGIYAFNNQILCERLPLLNNNNAQKEYYLTSLVGTNVGLFEIPDENQYEIQGVNTPDQLYNLHKI